MTYIYLQIKSIIINENISNKNKSRNLTSSENQSHKYIIKFFIELTESVISDTNKIKPFLQYKNEFSKNKQKKLINAIKFANIISLGEMSFDQHYSFIQEGIITFEEQCKRLNEIKKEKEKEKEEEEEEEKEIIQCEKKEFENEEDYDIVLDDIKKEKVDLILNNGEINNYNNNNIYNNKNKVKNQISPDEANNEKSSDKEDDGKGRKIKSGRRKILGRKRNHVSNSVKNYLMMDLEYSIDDFIYNKRDFRINGYDSFFLNIQSKISKNALNNHGLNVSV